MNHDGFIAGEGLPFIIPLGGATLLAFVAGFKGISLLLLVVTLFVVWFFRNPQRNTPEKDGLVISPADGRVIRIEETTSDEQPGRTFQKISIFMNVFNVHVNRVPFDGKVIDTFHHQGKFFDARDGRASCENERNGIVLEIAGGARIAFVQIAGLVARRIISYPLVGNLLVRGERYGLIRFGSRVDVYLPTNSEPLVKLGDKTVAGETVLARMV